MARLVTSTAVIALCAVLMGCGETDADRIKWAQDAVNKQLKDPASAQHGQAFVVTSTESSDKFTDMRFVCGDVNAKNSFGGYTGATRYSVLIGKPSSGGPTEV